MTAWGELRPGHFDRALLGKRESAPGLFGASQARQMPGQGDLLDDTAPEDEPPADDSPCLELF